MTTTSRMEEESSILDGGMDVEYPFGEEEEEVLLRKSQNDINVSEPSQIVTRSQLKMREEEERKIRESSDNVSKTFKTLEESTWDFVIRNYPDSEDRLKAELKTVIEPSSNEVSKVIDDLKKVIDRHKTILNETEKNRVIYRDAYRMIVGLLKTKNWPETNARLQDLIGNEQSRSEEREELLYKMEEMEQKNKQIIGENEDLSQENGVLKKELEDMKMEMAEMAEAEKRRRTEMKSETFSNSNHVRESLNVTNGIMRENREN